MMNRIVFCPKCRQDIRFSVKEKVDSAELKGESSMSMPTEMCMWGCECGSTPNLITIIIIEK